MNRRQLIVGTVAAAAVATVPVVEAIAAPVVDSELVGPVDMATGKRLNVDWTKVRKFSVEFHDDGSSTWTEVPPGVEPPIKGAPLELDLKPELSDAAKAS